MRVADKLEVDLFESFPTTLAVGQKCLDHSGAFHVPVDETNALVMRQIPSRFPIANDVVGPVPVGVRRCQIGPIRTH